MKIRQKGTFFLIAMAMLALVSQAIIAKGADSQQNAADGTAATMSQPVKVFILLGQSNMVGLGHIAPLTFKGSLTYAIQKDHLYPWLMDKSGHWAVAKDVRYVALMPWRGENSQSMATLMNYYEHGFNGQGMQVWYNQWMSVQGHRFIGPEFGIEHSLTKVNRGPIMLLKSCNGNRSMGWDLLPPGSKGFTYTDRKGHVWQYAGYGQTPNRWIKGTPKAQRHPVGWYAGQEYDMDVANARYALSHLKKFCPGAKSYKVVGFFLWQGEKDTGDRAYAEHYEQNLASFIHHVRKDFNAPKAPFVMGTLGQDVLGVTKGNDGLVLKAQMALANPAKHPEFKGNVATVYTHPLSKGGSGNGHYNGNAQTYMDVGLAMGKAMNKLLSHK